jgi:hypothetical protein
VQAIERRRHEPAGRRSAGGHGGIVGRAAAARSGLGSAALPPALPTKAVTVFIVVLARPRERSAAAKERLRGCVQSHRGGVENFERRGELGAACCALGFADTHAQLGFAYIPNQMGTHLEDPRHAALRTAMYRSIGETDPSRP